MLGAASGIARQTTRLRYLGGGHTRHGHASSVVLRPPSHCGCMANVLDILFSHNTSFSDHTPKMNIIARTKRHYQASHGPWPVADNDENTKHETSPLLSSDVTLSRARQWQTYCQHLNLSSHFKQSLTSDGKTRIEHVQDHRATPILPSYEVKQSVVMETPTPNLETFPSGLQGRRILLCTESFGPVNGVSRTTLMLVNHLRSQGALVAVVAPHNHTQVNTFAPIETDEGSSAFTQEVRLAGYPLPVNPELSVVYPVRLSELYRRTFGQAPDLIYLASPASLGFQVMLQLRKLSKEAQVPILCNFQTDLAGYCEILFPAPLGTVASWVFGQVQSYLFRHESVKTIFYPSKFVRRYLEGSCGINGDKMDVLRRGVSTNGFNPSRRSEELRRQWAPNGEIILFTCSRIAGEKGYGFLARAAEELDRRGVAFKLVIVGGNRNPVVEQEVKDMFTAMAAKGKVLFAGFKVGEDLMTHYASADIFLHCSITETFGLVVLEAMASGVPVVARDEGGPSDIIDHGRTGLLSPPDDLEGFVGKVQLLATNTELRSHFCRAGLAQARAATWEKIGNKVAWKMLGAVEERETREAQRQLQEETRSAAMNGLHHAGDGVWRFMVGRAVDAKLVMGLLTIIGVWAAVGLYLAFIKVSHTVKTSAPQLHLRLKLWCEKK
ncbi:phosphatidylinositol alpha 1,6-mannosyltransferase [Microdochium nivale]|nr:phosphatidylinositol alpha 1,6-mannosyltransferase [Microdochium nivale]